MEAIKGLGPNVVEQIAASYLHPVEANQAFAPLLRANEKEILSYKSKTFKYGATDRHQLDVYFPHANTTGSAPILFYVYGGGYAQGARVLDPPNELKWKNVGAFFAKQGFVTVVADYRLFPAIKFPDPIVDIRDALAWMVANIDEVNEGASVQGDASRIFVLGHSAGGAIVSSLVLIPDLVPSALRKRIAGVVLHAGGYDFRGVPMLPPPILRGYHGETDDEVRKTEPLGLLENAPAEVLSNLPPILAVIGELDFPPVIVSHGTFVKTLREKVASPVDVLVLEGHNHSSPYNSLLSGEGEQWGLNVVKWLKARLD
ncbi:hypothetical protein EIP86_000086 [Pleurotus ostreatoroseus]|nr:hypothetical protein EIP86_000086 [Pleurotus ostreatoroseus]